MSIVPIEEEKTIDVNYGSDYDEYVAALKSVRLGKLNIYLSYSELCSAYMRSTMELRFFIEKTIPCLELESHVLQKMLEIMDLRYDYFECKTPNDLLSLFCELRRLGVEIEKTAELHEKIKSFNLYHFTLVTHVFFDKLKEDLKNEEIYDFTNSGICRKETAKRELYVDYFKEVMIDASNEVKEDVKFRYTGVIPKCVLCKREEPKKWEKIREHVGKQISIFENPKKLVK